MVQVFGGSDSTATAIGMILLYVVCSPAVYVKTRKELNENDNLFSGSLITSTNSRKLAYLQSCTKEGLRMWQALQALNSKLSPLGGEIVNGVYLPGKCHLRERGLRSRMSCDLAKPRSSCTHCVEFRAI